MYAIRSYYGVTSIEGYAFRFSSKLKSINLPKGLTSIQGFTFRDCTSLTSVDIPDGVTSIEVRNNFV